MPKAFELLDGMTMGADPEVFVVNEKGEAVFPDFIPGTKEEPFKVPGGAVQRDGCAAEFNIDPATTYKEFKGNVDKVLRKLKTFLPEGHELAIVPAVKFTDEQWDKVPDEAKVTGCSPDYNAWQMTVNPPPDASAFPQMAFAGGHVHYGWTDDADVTNLDHVNDCLDLVKQLDWYLGTWSVRKDRDSRRRKVVGMAGSSRIKPYGVEYRVLSNFWLRDAAWTLEMWNRSCRALTKMASMYYPDVVSKGGYASYQFNDRVIKSIDTGRMDASLEDHFYRPCVQY